MPPLPFLVGNGKKTPLWGAPWLNSSKPKYIAPLTYAVLIRNKWSVKNGLQENEWIAKTNISGDFSFDHMEQFVEL
jgi:hypothetical protein